MPFDSSPDFELPVITRPDTHLADILRAAWKAIEQHGWGKKSGAEAEGGPTSLCAVQANYAVNRYYHDAHLANRALERALPPGFSYITRYNDHPDTTLADMRALFDRAIDLAGG